MAVAPVERSSEITFRGNLEDPGRKWEVATCQPNQKEARIK